MSFKVLHQILLFFNRFLNARDNGVFRIGSLAVIVNPNIIEDYMNGFPIIVLNEQSILVIPMNHSLFSVRNDMEADAPNFCHPTQ